MQNSPKLLQRHGYVPNKYSLSGQDPFSDRKVEPVMRLAESFPPQLASWVFLQMVLPLHHYRDDRLWKL